MTAALVPFKPHHLTELDLQPSQAMLREFFDNPAYGLEAARHGAGGRAGTLKIDGRARICAGLVVKWQGTLTAWAAVSHGVPRRQWPRLVRVMRHKLAEVLDDPAVWRIETHVVDDFPQGHTLIRHLGFVPEGLHPCWGPDGRDAWSYARVCPAPATQEVTP